MFFEESHGDSGRPGRSRVTIRRFFPDPWWSRFKRGLIAVLGVVVAAIGVGSGPTGDGKVWSDISLLFFLTALTSPVWREAERDVAGQIRWREMLTRILWRTSVVLLYGAVAGLVTYRWSTLHGDAAGAHVGTVFGITSLLLAVVPPPLGPLLWRRFPAGLRRVERTARLMEELSLSGWAKPGRVRLELSPRAATPRAMAAATGSRFRFDPDLGASGRPEPLNEFLPGAPGGRGSDFKPRPSARLGPVVTWADGKFTVTGYSGPRAKPQIARYLAAAATEDPAGRFDSPLRAVAEIVLLETRSRAVRPRSRAVRSSSLLFLDARGYCFLDVARFSFTWRETMRLAAAAGVTFRSYSVDCTGDNAGKIQDLMFPRCVNSRSFTR